MSNGLSSTQITLKEASDLYENGKHRRYSLLFSVNGGAFAIAKLLTVESCKPSLILGNLTLAELAFGMAAYTAVMAADIYIFGEKMRSSYQSGIFGPAGKVVLILLAGLLCIGWLLVGIHRGDGA
jgi:purine-cytosine permease-like protein